MYGCPLNTEDEIGNNYIMIIPMIESLSHGAFKFQIMPTSD